MFPQTFRIVVDPTLKGKRELEIIAHEVLHAQDYDLDEQAVLRRSKELTDILWKLGYRRVA